MNISEILLYLPTILLACVLIISSIIAIAMLPWSTQDFQQGTREFRYVISQIKCSVKEGYSRFLDLKQTHSSNIGQRFSEEIAEDITGIRRRRAM